MAGYSQFLPLAMVFRQSTACTIFSLGCSLLWRFITEGHYQSRTITIFSQRRKVSALPSRLAMDSGRTSHLWINCFWSCSSAGKVLPRNRSRPEGVCYQLFGKDRLVSIE